MDLSIVRFIPDPAFLVRKETLEIMEGNQSAAEICGCRLEKLPGKNLSGFFPETPIRPGKFEEVLFRDEKDLYFPVSLDVHPVDDKDKSFYLLVFHDHKLKLKDLMEYTSDGLIILDEKLTVLDVNPAFCSITELERDVLIGGNGFDLARKLISAQTRNKIITALQKMADAKCEVAHPAPTPDAANNHQDFSAHNKGNEGAMDDQNEVCDQGIHRFYPLPS